MELGQNAQTAELTLLSAQGAHLFLNSELFAFQLSQSDLIGGRTFLFVENSSFKLGMLL